MRACQVPVPTASPIDRPLMPGSLRDHPRRPLDCEVEIRFRDFDSTVSAHSLNISSTGMFIRSREAQPAGSTLSFELSLDRAEQLIRGVGEVVWMRRFELGVGRPAGMGIRFLDLEEMSAKTLEKFLAECRGEAAAGRSRDGRPADRSSRSTVPGMQLASMPAFAQPLSGLTETELSRLYSFAGSASTSRHREWSRLIKTVLSRAAGAARHALLGRKTVRAT